MMTEKSTAPAWLEAVSNKCLTARPDVIRFNPMWLIVKVVKKRVSEKASQVKKSRK